MNNNISIMKTEYKHLYPIQIISVLVVSINSLIDSFMTAHFLGTNALAAIAFFSPIITIINMSLLIVSGIQVLCPRFIGYGQRDRINSLFTTGTLFCCSLGMLLTILFISFRLTIATMLGASRELIPLLSDYILGYSFGITTQILSQLFITMLPLNNHRHMPYYSIFAMIFINSTLNIIFLNYFSMGCFGMGLATSISYIISTLILFFGFISEDNAICFNIHSISFKDFPEALKLGLPVLFFNIGVSLKSFILNNTLLISTGSAAVAVLNVQGSLCSLLGSIPYGCASALMILGSIYYGENDRKSLIECMKYTIKIGMIICIIIITLLITLAPLISSMLFSLTDEAYGIAIWMLRIFPLFLIFSLILNALIKIYNITGKIWLVNFTSVTEQVLIAIIAIIMVYFIGINGVWWSFPLATLFCIIIIGGFVFFKAKGFTIKPDDWMMLSDNFGASNDDYIDMTIKSMDDVIGMSKIIIEFCKRKGMGNKESFYAGLAIEEMAGNIIMHGFTSKKKQIIEVKVIKKENLVIRIQDNCPLFDPKKRIDQFYPDDICRNVGIRLIAGIAKDMNYQNNIGINTLFITI